jgi:outer membrane immunogenic protein
VIAITAARALEMQESAARDDAIDSPPIALAKIPSRRCFSAAVAATAHTSRKRALNIAAQYIGVGSVMRRSAVGIAFALSLASTVPAAAYERPFSWTGLYIGVNAGYSWGRADATLSKVVVNDIPVEGAVRDRARVDGGLAGGQIGYSWQSKGWVFGVEADFQWTGQDGDVPACVDLISVCGKASYELDWFGTVRGRAGYLVFPDTLLYFTGGLAYGRVNADFSLDPSLGTTPVRDSATKTGWVIGGGLEWALDRSWRVRAEYLYMDLGSMRTELGPISATIPDGEFPIDVTASGTVRTDFTDQIVRLGVSYKFGEAYAPLK